MPFRLGANLPGPTDGTSFYRAMGPLQALDAEREDFSFEVPQQINWAYLRASDGVFMQRPFRPEHIKLIQMTKAHGKPVWIDYDDDLFTVPLSNPTHKVYGEKSVANNILTCITQADIISVSTVCLQDKLQRILAQISKAGDKNEKVPFRNFDPEKVVLVPNAYDEKMFGYSFRDWNKPVPDASLTVLWRGSSTHDADLWEYTEPMARVFSRHGKLNGNAWTMNLIGSPFWLTMREMEREGVPPEQIIVTPTMDPIDYMMYLKKIKPAAVIVPLLDDPFNRSKSNVAWLEATHAGAVVLAPDWEEWRRPGILNYKDKEDFAHMFSGILMGLYDREKLVQQSRDYIAEHLTLTKVNRLRSEILSRMEKIDVWSQHQ